MEIHIHLDTCTHWCVNEEVGTSPIGLKALGGIAQNYLLLLCVQHNFPKQFSINA